MNQKHYRQRLKFALIAAIVTTLVAAVSAQAKVTDPRKCVTASTRANCARSAAVLVARRVLARKAAQTVWLRPVTCTTSGSLLRWRCSFTTLFPQLPMKGYVAVTYRATHTGWHVYTSIIATP